MTFPLDYLWGVFAQCLRYFLVGAARLVATVDAVDCFGYLLFVVKCCSVRSVAVRDRPH